ncbi:hypothetical protein [Microvirga sp. 2MCAF35]|uniref:hypothetical protein n=1 Tax=Microvirga sp. 2MCAF35 TaxID=3232987 RepID=UPI003F9B209F
MNRRWFLGVSIGTLIGGKSEAETSRRIAVLDWAMFETLLALGFVPVAATELVQFRKIAIEPTVPP